VATSAGLVPVHDVGEAPLGPAAGRPRYLFGEDAAVWELYVHGRRLGQVGGEFGAMAHVRCNEPLIHEPSRPRATLGLSCLEELPDGGEQGVERLAGPEGEDGAAFWSGFGLVRREEADDLAHGLVYFPDRIGGVAA
jgi:hypothetical protein